MNIRSKTMLGTHHSWSVTMRNLLLQFQNQGHKLYLESINGLAEVPSALKSRVNRKINIPDLDIAYTMPRNFQQRFEKKSKKKMAIYNYETDKLPKMWLDAIRYVDYVLPSSNFSKQVFIDAGWPDKKCVVIPHGINLSEFQSANKYPLLTNKKFNFLNVSIPHYRKNIILLLEAYYNTFSEEDDVCLVLKTNLDKPVGRNLYTFEIDLKKEIISLQQKYQKKLPSVEIVQASIPNMVDLYKSCDVLVNTASSEGFGLPLLEGLASGNLVIAPRCSGQLDFLNDKNSLLIDVKEINADEKYQYWHPTLGAKTWLPEIDSLSEQLLKAYQNKDKLKQQFVAETERVINKFTWEAAAKQILELV